ncbi:hypothetical protein E2C01_079087 [Portunus trituberculatus]|uniref:Uncharacterized protein n=1 Tax=Portunus trituberculatus TaxID=210409 RepID=A0A5B7IIR2_PORTR|nr:hypothetical protein [Portunus trituberculatus]
MNWRAGLVSVKTQAFGVFPCRYYYHYSLGWCLHCHHYYHHHLCRLRPVISLPASLLDFSAKTCHPCPCHLLPLPPLPGHKERRQ